MTAAAKPHIRLIALFLACVTLFMCSPIRAEAVALETIMLAAIPVLAAVIIGLGVMPGTQTGQAFANVVQDCADSLAATGSFILNGQIELAQIQNEDGRIRYGCAMELIEWVREWLVSHGIIRPEISVQYGSGFSLVFSEDIPDAVAAFWNHIDLYSIASAAEPGEVLCLTAGNTSLPATLAGLRKMTTSIGLDVIGEFTLSQASIVPYTSSNFPVGEFISLKESTKTALTKFQDYSAVSEIFLSYDDALTAYAYGNLGLDAYYFLTPESYIIPFTSASSSTGWSEVKICKIANLGAISAGGTVSLGDRFVTTGEGYSDYRYYFCPNDCESDQKFTSSLGEGGSIADPSVSLQDGYPEWYLNAIENGTDLYFPLGVGGDFNSTAGLTQEQIWGGSVYAASPVFDNTAHAGLVRYDIGEVAAPMQVWVSSPDGGSLTYQWYKDAIPIDGAVASVYYPDTKVEGESTYYCLVGNYKEVGNDATAAFAWSMPWVVTVGDFVTPDVTTPVVDGADIADSLNGAIADSKTELGTLSDSLADAAVPDYAGKIDLGFNKVFVDDQGKAGFLLASSVFENLFSNGGYIFWVFLFAFSLAAISFVVFGKKG